MRYFICAFGKIGFGIPAESTERIINLSHSQNSFMESADADKEIYVSLPALFKQNFTTPHGLVLKFCVSEDRKIILLTPKIEKDMVIPDENVRRLPKVFAGPFVFFNGMFFYDEIPVFVFNPDKIKGCVK